MRAEPGLAGTPLFLPSVVFYTRPEREKALSCAHGYGAEPECMPATRRWVSRRVEAGAGREGKRRMVSKNSEGRWG